MLAASLPNYIRHIDLYPKPRVEFAQPDLNIAAQSR